MNTRNNGSCIATQHDCGGNASSVPLPVSHRKKGECPSLLWSCCRLCKSHTICRCSAFCPLKAASEYFCMPAQQCCHGIGQFWRRSAIAYECVSACRRCMLVTGSQRVGMTPSHGTAAASCGWLTQRRPTSSSNSCSLISGGCASSPTLSELHVIKKAEDTCLGKSEGPRSKLQACVMSLTSTPAACKVLSDGHLRNEHCEPHCFVCLQRQAKKVSCSGPVNHEDTMSGQFEMAKRDASLLPESPKCKLAP